MLLGPRVEFDLEHSPRIRVWDPRAGHDRYIYLHRLTASAHDELAHLWSALHIQYVDEDRWINDPATLDGRPPGNHTDYHLNGVHYLERRLVVSTVRLSS